MRLPLVLRRSARGSAGAAPTVDPATCARAVACTRDRSCAGVERAGPRRAASAASAGSRRPSTGGRSRRRHRGWGRCTAEALALGLLLGGSALLATAGHHARAAACCSGCSTVRSAAAGAVGTAGAAAGSTGLTEQSSAGARTGCSHRHRTRRRPTDTRAAGSAPPPPKPPRPPRPAVPPPASFEPARSAAPAPPPMTPAPRGDAPPAPLPAESAQTAGRLRRRRRHRCRRRECSRVRRHRRRGWTGRFRESGPSGTGPSGRVVQSDRPWSVRSVRSDRCARGGSRPGPPGFDPDVEPPRPGSRRHRGNRHRGNHLRVAAGHRRACGSVILRDRRRRRPIRTGAML